MITYESLKRDEDIRHLIVRADESLVALGYTEHSFAHVTHVAETAGAILTELGFSERDAELSRIAGYLHDIGNLVNRQEHSQSGAVMAFTLLTDRGMPMEDVATVVTAIGNHDEGNGVPVNPVAAALILADKTDVRRSRVRNDNFAAYDIHDRVNYSVESADLDVDAQSHSVTLTLTIDTDYGSVTDYFEIFLTRMLLCRRAAEALGTRFKLVINGQRLL